jgi:hypothetical protein
MNSFQRIISISALIFSLSFAYYFFIYIPGAQRERRVKEFNTNYVKALKECEETRDNFLKRYENLPGSAPIIDSSTGEYITTAGELRRNMYSQDLKNCANIKLKEWGIKNVQ